MIHTDEPVLFMSPELHMLNSHFPHIALSSYRDLLGRSIEIVLEHMSVSIGNLEVLVAPQSHFMHIAAVALVHDNIFMWLERPIALTFKKGVHGFDSTLSCRCVLVSQASLLPVFENSNPDLDVRVSRLMKQITLF